MQYVCLTYAEEKRIDALPQDETDALIDEALATDEELRLSGRLVASAALDHVATATTVRVRGSRLSATDGPFAETNEQLGGFVLVEARDLNEAIQLAARLPAARYGSIEIRPVIDLLRERSPRPRD